MPPAAPSPTAGCAVLLFDGECGLCQRIVYRLLRCDRTGHLRFAPLQGAAAQELLRRRGGPTDDFDSLIFVPDWERRFEAPLLFRTAGTIAALRGTGRRSARFAAALLAMLPAGWRDAGYRFIAQRRQRWFGPAQPGGLDRPEWAARFLP